MAVSFQLSHPVYQVTHVVSDAFNFVVTDASGDDKVLDRRVAFFMKERDIQDPRVRLEIEGPGPLKERKIVWVKRADVAIALGCPEIELKTDEEGFLAVNLVLRKPEDSSLAGTCIPEDEAVVLGATASRGSFLAGADISTAPAKRGTFPTIYVGDDVFEFERVSSQDHETLLYAPTVPGSERLSVQKFSFEGTHPLLNLPTYLKLQALQGYINLPRVVTDGKGTHLLVSEHQISMKKLALEGAGEYVLSRYHSVQAFAQSLLQQLAKLHGVGVYHRNIRPSQIFKDGDVFKFGGRLDSLFDRDVETDGQMPVAQNPGYCCPHFWNEHYVPFDGTAAGISVIGTVEELPSNDVYGLGRILLEACYGSSEGNYPPKLFAATAHFRSRGHQKFLGQACEAPRLEPRETIGSWDDLILSMLTSDPKKRPSAQELYDVSLELPG